MRTTRGDQLEAGTISKQTVKDGEQVWEEKESCVSSSAYGVSIAKMSRQKTSPLVRGPSLLSPVSGCLFSAQ